MYKFVFNSLDCRMSNFCGTLMQSVQDDHRPFAIEKIKNSRYYLLPCFFLFDCSSKLLYLVLNSLKSLITEEVPLLSPHHPTHSTINHSNRIYTILSLLLLVHEDIKMKRVLLSQKTHIKSIIEEVVKFKVWLFLLH
jgi:pre-rRNA-processing protein IPI1